MKLKDLCLLENDPSQPINSTTGPVQATTSPQQTQSPIDRIPGLKQWLSLITVDEDKVEVHDDNSITIQGDVTYFPYGAGQQQYIPTVIRKITGDAIFFIENNMFEDAPKLNIHKWLKSVDGDVMVNLYDTCPVLSFLRIKIGGDLMVGYHTEDDEDDPDDTEWSIDENLTEIISRAHNDNMSIIDLQELLVDAGYKAFAKM